MAAYAYKRGHRPATMHASRVHKQQMSLVMRVIYSSVWIRNSLIARDTHRYQHAGCFKGT